jgi:acetyltransferase-like isoleucine patch superfamily enzyme
MDLRKFKKLGKDIKIFEYVKIVKPEVIEIGDYSEIDDFTFIYGGKGIKVGRYVHISRFVSIIGGGELFLGDYSVLADGSRILTGTDTYYGGYRMSTVLPANQRNPKVSFVRIEKDAFIGTNSIVHPGVNVGEGAIIGSNSLVLKDVEPWTINVGSPCKTIGKRPKVKFQDV